MRNYSKWTLLRWGMLLVASGLLLLASRHVVSQQLAFNYDEDNPIVTQPYLQRHYELFNNGWFDGSLPSDTQVKYQEIPEDLSPDGPAMGVTAVEHGHYVIYISPKYDIAQKVALETLFHELCHIEMNEEHHYVEEHGARWQRCMRQLADEGAFSNIW